jgi:hypothetical protein
MRLLNGKQGGAAAWCAALVAVVTLSSAPVLAQTAQTADASEEPTVSYTVLEHLSADAMSPDDVALVKSKQREISTEAAMFGYDLHSGQWSYDETVCPAIPDALLLHYRTAAAANGAHSLFTAIVPRGQERVLVNPVLYHGATPFAPAIVQQRTISVFNQTVPAEAAEKDLQPDGHWLTLAICFAEIAGAEPRVPEHPELETALIKAPSPTLRLSEDKGTTDIEFTGREAPANYTVWDISVNAQGHAVTAASATYPNYTAPAQVALQPEEKVVKVKEASEPKVKVVPDLPEPPQKPVPQ